MGQCVDPLAMLPGRWDLVRKIEIKPLVRTRIGRLQADGVGESTKAVVGWIISDNWFLLRPFTLMGPYDFPCPKWFPTQSIVKLASPRLTRLSESDCCLLILDSIRTFLAIPFCATLASLFRTRKPIH